MGMDIVVSFHDEGPPQDATGHGGGGAAPVAGTAQQGDSG